MLLNMVVPFVLPFASFPMATARDNAITELVLPVVTIGSEVSEKANALNILPIAYIAISFALLGYLAAQMTQIMLFLKRYSAENRDGIRLIKNTTMGPGSWFNYVFIPAEEADNAVLLHEQAHVSLKHSYDIVLMRLLQCLAWPNAMLFVIAKELKTVHEFQADAAAGIDRQQYSTTLLNELFHTRHFALSHTFFHHPIKRRIMMLQNKARTGKLKAVVLFTMLVAGIVFFQSANVVAQSKKIKIETQDTKAEPPQKTFVIGSEKPDTAAIRQKLSNGEGIRIRKISDNGETATQSTYDVPPRFDGDMVAYLVKNIKYPKDAQAEKAEGRVLVLFDVNEKGNLENIEVLNNIHPSLTESAKKVVQNMPRWKPGIKDGKPVKVRYTLPIMYKLP